jgi:hypothetical protein
LAEIITGVKLECKKKTVNVYSLETRLSEPSSLSDLVNGILATPGVLANARLYNRPATSESADFVSSRQRSQRKPMERTLDFSGPQVLFAVFYP